MNKTFKAVTASVILAYFTLASIFAANLSETMPAGGLTNLFGAQSPAQTNRGGGITQITIANPNTSPLNLRLIDSGTTNIVYTNAAVNGVTRSVVTWTNTYTDPLGATVTNIYTAVTNNAVTIAAATNSLRTINFWTVASNTTFIVTYANPNIFNLGLVITNSAACTISVDYNPF